MVSGTRFEFDGTAVLEFSALVLRRAGPPTSVNERPSPGPLRLPLPRTLGPGDRAT